MPYAKVEDRAAWSKRYKKANLDKVLYWADAYRKRNRVRLRIRHKQLYDEKYKARNRRYDLKKKYGLTFEEYERLIAEQNGLCAICNLSESVHKNLVVDHDHATGKLRQMLCFKCNCTLGLVGDSTTVLQEMINYLNKHKENNG